MDSTCYHDSRVSDLIAAGAMADGSDKALVELLRTIHDDWCSEHGFGIAPLTGMIPGLLLLNLH